MEQSKQPSTAGCARRAAADCVHSWRSKCFCQRRDDEIRCCRDRNRCRGLNCGYAMPQGRNAWASGSKTPVKGQDHYKTGNVDVDAVALGIVKAFPV